MKIKIAPIIIIVLLTTFGTGSNGICWCDETGKADFSWNENFTGELRSTLRFRDAGSDEDTDFYQYWYLEGRDFFDKHFDLYFSGSLHKDLDGTSQSFADNSLMI